jgi:CDGSH-type Zn-finger protein
MPEVTTIEKDGRLRLVFALQPGERAKICSCYSSKKFPFCDGTHSHLHTNLEPAILDAAQAGCDAKEATPDIPG